MRIKWNRIWIFAETLAVMFGWLPPALLTETPGVNLICNVIQLVSLAYLTCYIIYNIRKLKVFDILILLAGLSIVISGIVNVRDTSTSLNASVSFAIRVVFLCLYQKIVLFKKSSERRVRIESIAWYINIICIVNTASVFVIKDAERITTYFLGGDNGAASYYILAIFYAYILFIVHAKRKKVMLIASIVNFSVFALVRQIGTMLLCLIVFVLLAVFSRFKKKTGAVQNPAIAIVLSLLVMYIGLNSQFASMQDYINQWFFGKYDTFSSRMFWWSYFGLLTLDSPFWGHGMANAENAVLKSTLAQWYITSGNTHNMLLYYAYHFGYIVVILFFVLVVISTMKIVKHGRIGGFLGALYVVQIVHGLLEIDSLFGFLYLPIMYYVDELFDVDQEE